MYKNADPNDTIAAISTAAGAGGIGIIRLSGSEALKIADRMFIVKDGENRRRLQVIRFITGGS